jgi:hypothetical protein
MREKKRVTYVKGQYAGLTIMSLIEDRGGQLWAKPLNVEYRLISGGTAIGFEPIGAREDWTNFGFIAD